MTDTTYDEAKRCPRCKNPGQDAGKRPGQRGSTMHTFKCMNERCRWYNTSYVIQVNSDGTIPPPNLHRDKTFPKLPERSDEDVERMNQFFLNQTLQGGETR